MNERIDEQANVPGKWDLKNQQSYIDRQFNFQQLKKQT